jgi:hypothetical protein
MLKDGVVVGSIFLKAMQISEAVSCYGSFEQNVTCYYQFSADAVTVEEINGDIVFVEIVFCGCQIALFAWSVTGEAKTYWNNKHRLRWKNFDGWANKLADFVWCHFGNGIVVIGCQMLPFVEKTIVVVKDIIEDIIDLVFHFLSITRDASHIERSLLTQRDSIRPVAYWDVESRDQDRLFTVGGRGEVVMLSGTFLTSSRCACLGCFFNNSDRFRSISKNFGSHQDVGLRGDYRLWFSLLVSNCRPRIR